MMIHLGYQHNSSPSRGSSGHLLPAALLRRDRQKSHPQPNSSSITPFQVCTSFKAFVKIIINLLNRNNFIYKISY